MAAHASARRILVSLVALAISAGATLGGEQAGGPLGIGRVFFPNPVATLQDQSLTDRKDADYPALEPAYRHVVLTNLDGSGFLRGDWANVVSETGPPAFSHDNIFLFGRHDDRFEQVMAYYWVTEAQRYIQRLGFGTTLRPINRQSQDIRINQWGTDNSYSWAKHDVIRFGKGGVDDAEDAEVILHEYAHAMMDSQMTPFGFGGSLEAAAIGEGFADYWAVTVSNVMAPTPDPACVADWDSTSYTTAVPHCLRRVDSDLRYPEDLTGEVYHDGLIWSRALWDIRNALGHVKADTIILEGIFGFDPDTAMPAAADATVKAAERLYGKAAAKTVARVFQARGILQQGGTAIIAGVPETPLSLDTSPEIERRQIEAWRQMSAADKAATVTGLTRAAFAMTAAGVRQRYPDASPREQFLRVAVVVLGPELARLAYPDAAEVISL